MFSMKMKCNFQCAFDDNLSLIHFFIKQTFRAAGAIISLRPFPLSPTGLYGGSGSCFHPLAAALVMDFKP
jgi:hypothetical protein